MSKRSRRARPGNQPASQSGTRPPGPPVSGSGSPSGATVSSAATKPVAAATTAAATTAVEHPTRRRPCRAPGTRPAGRQEVVLRALSPADRGRRRRGGHCADHGLGGQFGLGGGLQLFHRMGARSDGIARGRCLAPARLPPGGDGQHARRGRDEQPRDVPTPTARRPAATISTVPRRARSAPASTARTTSRCRRAGSTTWSTAGW